MIEGKTRTDGGDLLLHALRRVAADGSLRPMYLVFPLSFKLCSAGILSSRGVLGSIR